MNKLKDKLKDDDLIEVCDNCFHASCWQGIFMCDGSQMAGTVKKTVKWLKENTDEHESYFAGSKVDK